MNAMTDLHLQIWSKCNIIQLNFIIFFYTEIVSETYEQYTVTGGIVALAAILLVPLSPNVAKASSKCSLQSQANDKTGFHTLSRSVSSQCVPILWLVAQDKGLDIIFLRTLFLIQD